MTVGAAIGLLVLGFLMGHTMAQAKSRDLYPARTGEAARWVIARLRELLNNDARPIDSKQLVGYLATLSHEIATGHIVFHPVRSMRAPGTVSVGGEDKGPISG